jgi:ribulose-5-phosphate 4-epimerase/fuculose-1-phosphate aldolase
LVDAISLVREYSGQVNDPYVAGGVIAEIGDSNIALLGNHGVLVAGKNINELITRAVYLEYRCRSAWHVESLSGGVTLDESVAHSLQAFQDSAGGGFPGLWAALARTECELDPAVLD